MRIIAGQLKGRRLDAPAWSGLRPSSDKLRETLFNVLAARVQGARVLDGYAGTGAVGIEAISRGAAHVMFVEQDPRALALIRANLARCGIEDGYTIERGDVAGVLRRSAAAMSFDLVLLDPPYALDPGAVTGALDAAASRLSTGGLMVLERSKRREPQIPASLQRIRDVISGDSALTLMQVPPR
jgi:16S rRNA (guanine(966)-N(2))-methyltransferase RsmD